MKRILNAFSLLILIEALAFGLFSYMGNLDMTSMMAAFMAGTAACCMIALQEKSLIKKTPRQQGPKN